MKPTLRAIEQVLAGIADLDPEPVEPTVSGYWSVSAFDVTGEYQGTGTGASPQEAAAGAWVNANLSDEFLGCGPHTYSRLLADVPLAVPDDWTFEIEDFPTTGAA